MADVSKDILDLNERVAKARDRLIRLQAHRDALQRNYDTLVKEIRAAGYDPENLQEVRATLQQQLEDLKQDLEKRVSLAESQLNSIPE